MTQGARAALRNDARRTGAEVGAAPGRWGIVLVMLAALSWGTTGTTSRLLAMSAHAAPALVGFMRMAIAAPLLLLAARLGGYSLRPRGPAFLVAGLCMASYQLTFFSAVPRAGVAVTALMAICTAPLMIALLAAVALHEPITARLLVALLTGVSGTALLVGGSGMATGRDFLLGILGAALLFCALLVLLAARPAGVD